MEIINGFSDTQCWYSTFSREIKAFGWKKLKENEGRLKVFVFPSAYNQLLLSMLQPKLKKTTKIEKNYFLQSKTAEHWTQKHRGSEPYEARFST